MNLVESFQVEISARVHFSWLKFHICLNCRCSSIMSDTNKSDFDSLLSQIK